jgi:glycosyltransferase involved in cell wall biosynthesis
MSDHLVGLRLKKRLGVPWVAHFSDPWADNPFRAGQFIANWINRRLEGRVIEAAERVVFTSAETRDLVMRKYPASWNGKCAVLPHSYDPSLYPEPAARGKTIVVRHIGNFYGQRTPLPLLRALRMMEPGQLDDVRLELVGRVPSWLRFHPAWRALPADLVCCKGNVDYARSLALMVEADLLLVIDAPGKLSVFLPSKLVDYLGARVPLMGITPPGAAASLLRQMGGIVADPSDTRQVAAGLERALADVRKRREGVPSSWGSDAVRRSFVVERIAQDFARLLAETAGLSPGPAGVTG